MKMKKDHGGIILCDEFEKADKSIIFFFLELLEDGYFTDSQGQEWDLNGYIIIFTSNISEKDFNQKIPTEFKSRLDLIVQFEALNDTQKLSYINYKKEQLKSDIKKIKGEVPDTTKADFSDLLKIDDLRSIEREIQNKILYTENLN